MHRDVLVSEEALNGSSVLFSSGLINSEERSRTQGGRGCCSGRDEQEERMWEQKEVGAACLPERQFQVTSSVPASLWEAAVRQVVS